MAKIFIDAGGSKIVACYIKNGRLTKHTINDAGCIIMHYQKTKNNLHEIFNFFKEEKEVDFSDPEFELIIGMTASEAVMSKTLQLENELKNELKCENIKIVNNLTMLTLFIEDDNYLIVNAGTSSNAVHKKGENIDYYLGWGRAINDVGSGYDIGSHFAKFLAYCEDYKKNNFIYQKFLNDHDLVSVRKLIQNLPNSIIELSRISFWLSNQDETTIELFILNRIRKLFDYLQFINYNNLYLTGSVFEKNKDVQELVLKLFPNKQISIINLEKILDDSFCNKE